MGWFSNKKDDPPAPAPTKEPIDWDNLAPDKCTDGQKAVRDIANMTATELNKLRRLRGGSPGAFQAMYSAEERAEYLVWMDEEEEREKAALAAKKKSWWG